MVSSTYIHVPGIGEKTEGRIWNSGACFHREFLNDPPGFLSKRKTYSLIEGIALARRSLEEGDPSPIYRLLPSSERWRLFSDFSGTAAFLDIETTGLDPASCVVTTIALHDGKEVFTYVNGVNLNSFANDIRSFGLLVTYNGLCFDLPFIRASLGVDLSTVPHIDLRYLMNGLGFRGGQKCCELRLGMGRRGAVSRVDGYMAVLLWEEYIRSGNESVLQTLLHYNVTDTVNLHRLMVEGYNRRIDRLPVPVEPLPVPASQENPFSCSEEIVERVRWRKHRWE